MPFDFLEAKSSISIASKSLSLYIYRERENSDRTIEELKSALRQKCERPLTSVLIFLKVNSRTAKKKKKKT